MNLLIVESPSKAKTIEKYLGKKKKIAEATPEQVEMIYLIVQDLKDELSNMNEPTV